MKRFLIASIISFALGCFFIATSFGFNSFELNSSSGYLIALGYFFLILPYSSWLIASNYFLAIRKKKSPKLLISLLALYSFIALLIGFGGATAIFTTTIDESIFPVFETGIVAFVFSGFGALIWAGFLISKEIVNWEGRPRANRATHIFILTIGFVYIPIGMFFIAKRLKTLPTTRPHSPY